MVFTIFQIIVVVGVVFTGAANTLITKFMMRIYAVGVDGISHTFEHPVFQCMAMFVGETLCLIWFYILLCYYKKTGKDESNNAITKGSREFNKLLICIPACMDLSATIMSQCGLVLTYASSFQIFRSSVIIFVSILGRIFLKTAFTVARIVGVVLVIIGLTSVGVGDYLISDKPKEGNSTNTTNKYTVGKVIAGDILVIIGELFHAIQVVYEEKILTSLDIPPMLCVGWEGVYGGVISGLCLIPSYYIIVGEWSSLPKRNLDDGIDAILQLVNSWEMFLSLFSMMVSISLFNYFILNITKELNSVTSMVFDSLRTTLVWVFCLIVFHQDSHFIQFIGFTIQVLGTFIYNDAFSMGNIKWVISKMRRKPLTEEGQDPDKSQKTD